MEDGTKRYVCAKCGVKYKHRCLLRGHLKECGIGVKCPYCPRVITQKRNLKKHMNIHARDKYNSESNSNKNNQIDVLNNLCDTDSLYSNSYYF